VLRLPKDVLPHVERALEYVMNTKFLLVAVAVLFGMAATVNAATIANGSFETQSPQFSGSFETLNAGSSALSGWTVGGNSIDLINTYWSAENGNYSLDMSGNDAGSISQTITGLAVGAFYKISFWLAGNPDGSLNKSLSAGTNEGSSIFTFVQAGHTSTSMGWVQNSFIFQAAATTTKLTFASLNAGGFGPALDNVSIDVVPLPSGAPLQLVGVAGLVALRRRKSV
jgi:choice-of-anchor C domain-containing protein